MRGVPTLKPLPTLYPEAQPARSGRLAVTGGHELQWFEWGRPEGTPALLLHGGPGSGLSAFQARFFDPQRLRVIGFDQRGAGLSTPAGATQNNTTADLLDDIVALREHLDLPRCLVVGGSWGATLALASAAHRPDAVSGLLLRGVFVARGQDIEAFFDAAALPANDVLAPWRDQAAAAGVPLVDSLDRVLNGGGDERACAELACAWWRWEQAMDGSAVPGAPDAAMIPALLQRYRVQAHYLRHGCGFGERPLLDRLGGVPRVPTLLLHGEHDRICAPAGAMEVQRRLPGSVLRRVAGAGHAPTHPAMAAAMVRALTQWAAHADFAGEEDAT